ncbi:Cilia- and flagella-associated protein 47, partial [Blyttiomyces sp. JEL0837]
MQDPKFMNNMSSVNNGNGNSVNSHKEKDETSGSGSRPTVFTHLSSVSFQSVEAASFKETRQSSYFAVRVDPPQVVINDYEPGSCHIRTVTIKNFSATVQKIVIQPPKSKQFRLAKDTKLNGTLLAPGLSISFDVEFTAPSGPTWTRPPTMITSHHNNTGVAGANSGNTGVAGGVNSGNNTTNSDESTQQQQQHGGVNLSHLDHGNQSSKQDLSQLTYTDVLGIEVKGDKGQQVPLIAVPAGPMLQFPDRVEFGTLVFGMDGKQGGGGSGSASGSVNNSVIGGSSNNMIGFGKPLGVQYLTLRNVGRRAARFRILHDPHLPVRVTPDSGILGVVQTSDGSTVSQQTSHPHHHHGEGNYMHSQVNTALFPDKCQLKIEFLSRTTGVFEEKVYIELESDGVAGFGHGHGIGQGGQGQVATRGTTTTNVEGGISHSSTAEPLYFTISANVVNHKLRLRNSDNTADLDPNRLNFGVIYFSQRACLSAKLENRGPSVIKWVITHAGESSPMIPPHGSRTSNNVNDPNNATNNNAPGTPAGISSVNMSIANRNKEDAENKASMSVYPTEGCLGPYQTMPIRFIFAPRINDPEHGFKTKRTAPSKHMYRVPMQLKIIKSGVGSVDDQRQDGGRMSLSASALVATASAAGEDPIDLSMIGKACPILASLSLKDIKFKDAIAPITIFEAGELTADGIVAKAAESNGIKQARKNGGTAQFEIVNPEHQTIELQNNSDQLGFRFHFKPVAHFHAIPSMGVLAPQQKVSINIIFKPNQIGHFATTMECVIKSLDDFPAVDEEEVSPSLRHNLQVKFDGGKEDAEIKKLKVHLKGCCKPTDFEKDQKAGNGPHDQQHHRHLELQAKESSLIQPAKKVNQGMSLWRSNVSEDGVDGEQAFDEWKSKWSNKHRYWDYLKETRTHRLTAKRTSRMGDDGVLLPEDKVLVELQETRMDIENGLVPPEPTEFEQEGGFDIGSDAPAAKVSESKSGAVAALGTPKTAKAHKSNSHGIGLDKRKIKALFQKLMEPVVHSPISKNKSNGAITGMNVSVPATAVADQPLTGEDLSNIFAAHEVLDFGAITVHSKNVLPLNFLNMTPSQVPIHIALIVDSRGIPEAMLELMNESDNAYDFDLRLRSGIDGAGNLSLAPLTVAGFEVSLRCDRVGIFQTKVTYLINGRYKYQIPIRAYVNPVELELSDERLMIEVPAAGILAATSLDLRAHSGAQQKEKKDEKYGMASPLSAKTTEDYGSPPTLSRPETADVTAKVQAATFTDAACKDKHDIPRAEKTVTLYNRGNFPASFHWLFNGSHGRGAKNAGDADFEAMAISEGKFTVQPEHGSIEAHGSAQVQVIYTPGIKPTHEETLQVQVIDDQFSRDSEVVKTLSLHCKGEIASSTCVLMTSTKQWPVDLGVIPVASEENKKPVGGIELFDVVDSLFLATATNLSTTGTPATATETTKTSRLTTSTNKSDKKSIGGKIPEKSILVQNRGNRKNPKSAPSINANKGWRSIKVKNTSSTPCFFMVKSQSNSPDVSISPTSGIILGGGSILDINLHVKPTKAGIFEDCVLITIIGGGKVLKVPFRYEGRQPSVSVRVGDLQQLSRGTVIGSWDKFDITFTNEGTVTSRVLVDLRQYPDFRVQIKQEDSFDKDIVLNPALGRVGRIGDSVSARPKTDVEFLSLESKNIAKNRLKQIPADDPILIVGQPSAAESQIATLDSRRPASPRRTKRPTGSQWSFENTSGCLYAFEVTSQEVFTIEVIYEPKTLGQFSFSLPISLLGADTCPSIDIDAYSVPSPIILSKTSINFKNKVVYRDSGIIGVSHLKSVAKEPLIITNNSQVPINWSFDLEPLEELDNVFKLEPSHGSLGVNGTQNVMVSFHPELTGVFETKIPLHVDFMGRQAPFSLAVQGTGVEPSLAFEPPEIFLPVVPLGSESSATFYIVNYGFTGNPLVTTSATNIAEASKPAPAPAQPQQQQQQPPAQVNQPTVETQAEPSDATNGKQVGAPGAPTTDPQVKAPEVEAPVAPTPISGPVSFTLKIEFSDNNHRVFFLPVHGTTDQSLLTLYSYMWRTREDHKTIAPESNDAPITYEPIKAQTRFDDPHRRTRMLAFNRSFRSPTGIILEGEDLQVIETGLNQTSDTLMRWLEDHIGTTL